MYVPLPQFSCTLCLLTFSRDTHYYLQVKIEELNYDKIDRKEVENVEWIQSLIELVVYVIFVTSELGQLFWFFQSCQILPEEDIFVS